MLTTIVLPILTSAIGGFLVLWILNLRTKRLKKELVELEEEKDLLTRLNKKNSSFLRAVFAVLFYVLAILFVSFSCLFFLRGFNILSERWFFLGSGYALLVVGIVSLTIIRTIINVARLEEVKARIEAKQQAIKEKLDT